MFGSSKKKETGNGSGVPSSNSNSLNSLVQGTISEGKIKAVSDIRIDGTVKGELSCEAKVIIGPTGVIEGTVICKNAVIEGRFEGNLTVSELLNIRETAKVTGEVSYGKLVVQSGAVINGSYRVGKDGSNGAAKSSSEANKVVNTPKSEQQNIAGKQFSKEKAN